MHVDGIAGDYSSCLWCTWMVSQVIMVVFAVYVNGVTSDCGRVRGVC
jgi:hypothetical protein